MRERTIALFTLFCLLVNSVSGYVKPLCFIDQYLKELDDKNKLLCSGSEWMTHFTPDDNSTQFCSENDNSLNGVSYPFYHCDQPDEYKEKFVFAGVKDGIENDEEVFLNVTISEIKFKRLWIRVQNCLESTQQMTRKYYWQMVNLTSSHTQRNLSLFLSVDGLYTMKIAFYAEGENDYKFFRQYVFMAPSVFSLDNPDIIENQLMTYVDTTISDKVCLYIQPFPQHFNIVRYEGVFQYRDSPNVEKVEFNLTQVIWHYDQSMFSEDAMYSFVITPVSADGKRNLQTCIEFYMTAGNQKLIVMMVSLLVVPIVICFVLYLIYAYCRCQAYPRFREPYCLLIYPPTHDSHVDVMLKLAEYLKGCRINAMIDVPDIPKEPDNNPKYWCEKSFRRASTVVVSWSLPANISTVVTKTIYRGLYEYTNRLIHYCTNKKYLAIKFSYCDEKGAPTELRSIKPLNLPDQLKKLINQIHDFDYTEIHDIPDPKELFQSIRSAQQNISKCVSNSVPHRFGELPEFIQPLIIERRIFDDAQNDTSSNDRNSEVPEDESDDENRIVFERLNLHGPQTTGQDRNTDESPSNLMHEHLV